MQLNSVTLKNWKGQNTSLKLARLNLVTGPNGSGKTALLEAIQFACEGRTSLGDSPQAAIAFMGTQGGGVHVGLETANGLFGWRRELIIDHSDGGKVSQELSIDGRGVGKVKETEGAIKERIGRDGEVFAPMFDLHRFLDLSDDKRRDFVLDLCARAQRGGGADGTSGAAALSNRISLGYLRESLGDGTVATNQDREDAIAFLVGKLSEGERQAFGEIMAAVNASLRGDVADALNAALTAANDGIKAARRGKDDAAAAVREISERLAAVQVSAETAESLRAKLEQVRVSRGEIEQQIARQGAVQSTRDGLARRISEIRTSIETHKQSVSQPYTPEADPAELEAEAEELSKIPPQTINLTDLEGLEQQARHDLGEAQQSHSELMDKVRQAKMDAERIQNHINDSKSDDWRAANSMLGDFEANYGWPKDGEGHWRQIRSFVQDRMKSEDPRELEAKMQDATAAFNLANNEYEAASAILTQAKAALHAATEALREARSRANDQTREMVDRSRKADALRQKAIRIRQSIDNASRADAARADKIAQLERDVVAAEADLNRFDAELGGFVPTAELTAQCNALSESIASYTQLIKAKDGNDRLKDEYNACVVNAERQVIKWEVCKKLAEAVKKLREEIMAELVAPLLAQMDGFFLAGGVNIKAHCGLIDSKGSRVFDLGIERGDDRIVYQALSGGERCLVGAALAYALVQLADPPLKLLMLECAECDTETFDHIRLACQELQNTLSNVVIATWLDYGPDGWNCIDLSEELAEAAA